MVSFDERGRRHPSDRTGAAIPHMGAPARLSGAPALERVQREQRSALHRSGLEAVQLIARDRAVQVKNGTRFRFS